MRRWRRFGTSGASLIWGGEAVAVSHESRANPHQLVIAPHTYAGLAHLRSALLESYRVTRAARPASCRIATDSLRPLQSSQRHDRPEPRFSIIIPFSIPTGPLRQFSLLNRHANLRHRRRLSSRSSRGRRFRFRFRRHKALPRLSRPRIPQRPSRDGKYGGSSKIAPLPREIVEGIRRRPKPPNWRSPFRLRHRAITIPDPKLSSPGKPGSAFSKPTTLT